MALDQGHHLVATIDTPDIEKAQHAQQSISSAGGSDCDLAEIRLDALWPDVPDEEQATETLLALAQAPDRPPILATLRPQRQGGRFAGDETVRLGLLAAARGAGFDAVDLENDNQDMRALLTELRPQIQPFLLSDHRFDKTPSREVGLRHLTAMQDLGASIQKIAFPAGSFADGLRALELAHAHHDKTGRPSVQPIGFGGAQLRALLALAGNRATYGHAPGLKPAVPGQPSTADLQEVWRHWGLDSSDLDQAGSGWYAVIGASVAHSLSPRIHNRALAAAAKSQRFGALDVPDSDGALRLLVSVADRIGLRGISITNPHKERACQMVERDELAQAVGAVNCVRFGAGTAHGTNTDASALRRMLEPIRPERVLVLGAGGAARATIHAAKELGAQVTFCNRDEARADQVRKETGAAWTPWDDRHKVPADAVVQATPLGDPAGDAALDRLPEDCRYVHEMVYGHGQTALQTISAKAGVPCDDGRRLLLEQAADAFRFWTGQEPDRDAMQAALEADA